MGEILYNATLIFVGVLIGSLVNTLISGKFKKDKKEIYNRGYNSGHHDGYVKKEKEFIVENQKEFDRKISGNINEIICIKESLLPKKHKKLYQKILKKKGIKHQSTIAVEELNELAKELCKIVREKENMDNINEEMADVEIVLDELKLAFKNVEKIRNKKEEKIKRLEKRYKNDDL